MRSYTAEELERTTGFDRRTIAYYVQEGLIPKVGRRGPRTRYPKLVRDRLLFIRRVREAEESGKVSPVSLSAIREIFERIPAELIASVADEETPVTESIVSRTSIQARPPARRLTAIRQRWAPMEDKRDAPGSIKRSILPSEANPPSASMPSEDENMAAGIYEGARMERSWPSKEMSPGDGIEESELGDLLAALQEVARHRQLRASSSMDTWTRIEISPEIALSVRGVTDEDAGLLEKLGESLRRLINRRSRRQR